MDDDEVNYMNWTDIRHFRHRYIVNVPQKSYENQEDIGVELPYPVLGPVQLTVLEEHRNLFKPRSKTDTRLEYHKKTFVKDEKRLKGLIKNSKVASLPNYVVDVARGKFDDSNDHPWHYSGGTLDCLSFNGFNYLIIAAWKGPLQVWNIDALTISSSIELDGARPVYNIKSQGYQHGDVALLAIRQKKKISLLHLKHDEDDTLGASFKWKAKASATTYVDVSFNRFKTNEISVIDATHNFRIVDFQRNANLVNYDFSIDPNAIDHFAQISYVDQNTLAFINRCGISLLDVRSLAKQHCELNKTWLKCDVLCSLCTESNDPCGISLASAHSLSKFDTRALKLIDKTMHMLSTPPFISSVATNDGRDNYTCLVGEQFNDKALVRSSRDLFDTSQYIPNRLDTLTAASLTRTLNVSLCLENRLSVPTIGMKFYTDNSSDHLSIFTLSTVGDVFKQRVLKKPFDNEIALDRFAEWENDVEVKPKMLEATSIVNLNDVMHLVSSRFPHEKNIRRMVKQGHSKKLAQKKFSTLSKYFKNSVGESLNSIWDVEEEGISTLISAKHKVSEWLDSVVE